MKNARVIEYRRFNKEEIGAITESLDVLGNLMEREKDAKMHKAYENALRAMRNEITLHEIGDENTVKCGNCATYFDERELPRFDNISATKIRKAIREGDKSTFLQMMPIGLHSEWLNLQKSVV